jgi:hypothetical protein
MGIKERLDVDGDGKINMNDLVARLDVDKNGKVNFADVVTLAGGYNMKLVIGCSAIAAAVGFLAGAVIF